MLNKNIVSFLGCDAEYDEARVVLFGAPFDSTTSFRPGTRFAGPAIRGDSWGLETYSPYQDRDLTDCHIFDSGDLELAIGDSEKVLAVIEERAETILKDDKLPFLIGGEHLVTLGSIRAAARKYPDLHIIHLDAHTDLREDYLGVRLSHACVIRRCWEIWGTERFISLEFVLEKRMSLNGRNQDIQACTHLIWKGWKRQWNLFKENRFILRWIWMYWIRRSFREQGRRSREELII